EGGGVADVLLRKPDGQVDFDFHGKLAFAWPSTALPAKGAPAFPLGYGLTYADHVTVPALSEQSGVTGTTVRVDDYLEKGAAATGYTLNLTGADGRRSTVLATPAASADGNLRMTAVDYRAQEDARSLDWIGDSATLSVDAGKPLDLDRQANGDVMLVTTLRLAAPTGGPVWIGMGCGHDCRGRVALKPLPPARWLRVGVPLKCLAAAGASMRHIVQPLVLEAGRGTRLAVSGAALGTNADQVVDCAR
ncbi:MAG TPA: putative glycoside hydrolase, partial [Rhodanobacter sp.]|nr:putative glycoside hydrolase [Rhodanobacter sp.]